MFGPSESAAVTGQIKLVLFDMDNVLCDYNTAKRVAWLAKVAGTTSESVNKAIWDSGFELLGDSGTLDAADYLRGFGDRIGYSLSLDEWIEARRRSMQADHAMLEIAGRLRQTVDIAVLTNNTFRRLALSGGKPLPRAPRKEPEPKPVSQNVQKQEEPSV